MTVTLSEFEEFMNRLHQQNLEKLSRSKLRTAIRHYWDVGSSATVDSRMKTLREEGWISKAQEGDKYELHEEQQNQFAKIMDGEKE